MAKTEDETFDVVILDLKIPDISGTEILKRIKQSHPETPVIMITGYSTVGSAVETMKLAYTVKVNPELCYGCLGCVVACAYENLGLPEDAPLRRNVLLASRLTDQRDRALLAAGE